MLFKTVAAQIKAAGPEDGLEEGEFEALVSVFGNIDSYGDMVEKGAFANTLKEWEASGNTLPVYYSHRMDDPEFLIGWVKEAKETDAGLLVKGVLDLDGGPARAKLVHRAFKRRTITQFSFAYDVIDGEWIDGDEKAGTPSYFALKELALYEVGPTPIGANQETDLLGVKRAIGNVVADVKAGRVLSSKNESALRDARDAIDLVLASLDKDEEDKSRKTARDAQATIKEPERVTIKEPPSNGPVDKPKRRPLADLVRDLELTELG